MVSVFIGIAIGIIFVGLFLPLHWETGARAVCESHDLELDSYEYIGNASGYEFIKCGEEVSKKPEPYVFTNIGGD